MMSSITPPLSLQSALYCAWPWLHLERSLVTSRCAASSARGPSTVTSPMCETSKMPTRSRTAACSSSTPLYCTGISQPANSTIRAPAARCASYSGVRSSMRGRRYSAFCSRLQACFRLRGNSQILAAQPLKPPSAAGASMIRRLPWTSGCSPARTTAAPRGTTRAFASCSGGNSAPPPHTCAPSPVPSASTPAAARACSWSGRARRCRNCSPRAGWWSTSASACCASRAREGCAIVDTAKTERPHARLRGTIHDTAEEVRKLGQKALAVRCNVREFDDVERMRNSTLEEFGRIDILVNNAGAIHVAPLAEWPAGKFDLVMDVNVRGAFLCSRAVIPNMRERKRGRIVMMSPPVSVAKVAGKAPYLVSKMGMTMLAHAIAEEERERGITAAALWPGTMIGSEATRVFHLGPRDQWRTPDNLPAATVAICCAEAAPVSGRAFYDEDVLRELRGAADFSAYSVVAGAHPAPRCRAL